MPKPLIENASVELDEIKSEDALKDLVKRFESIYRALREGQTNLFRKTDWYEKTLKKSPHMTTKQILQTIRQHAAQGKKGKESRTQKALELTESTHQGQALANHIHEYSFKHSNALCHTKAVNGKRIWSAKGLSTLYQQKGYEEKPQRVSENSRMGKIMQALGMSLS